MCSARYSSRVSCGKLDELDTSTSSKINKDDIPLKKDDINIDINSNNNDNHNNSIINSKGKVSMKVSSIGHSFSADNKDTTGQVDGDCVTVTGNTPIRVLLVDDSVAIQKVMKRWLENNGCIVTSAQNGKVGLALLKEQNFDITFMDFLMVSVLS